MVNPYGYWLEDKICVCVHICVCKISVLSIKKLQLNSGDNLHKTDWYFQYILKAYPRKISYSFGAS